MHQHSLRKGKPAWLVAVVLAVLLGVAGVFGAGRGGLVTRAATIGTLTCEPSNGTSTALPGVVASQTSVSDGNTGGAAQMLQPGATVACDFVTTASATLSSANWSVSNGGQIANPPAPSVVLTASGTSGAMIVIGSPANPNPTSATVSFNWTSGGSSGTASIIYSARTLVVALPAGPVQSGTSQTANATFAIGDGAGTIGQYASNSTYSSSSGTPTTSAGCTAIAGTAANAGSASSATSAVSRSTQGPCTASFTYAVAATTSTNVNFAAFTVSATSASEQWWDGQARCNAPSSTYYNTDGGATGPTSVTQGDTINCNGSVGSAVASGTLSASGAITGGPFTGSSPSGTFTAATTGSGTITFVTSNGTTHTWTYNVTAAPTASTAACTPGDGSTVAYGSTVSCTFTPGTGVTAGPNWTATGFTPPSSTSSTPIFTATTPPAGSITVTWTDAAGSGSATFNYTISPRVSAGLFFAINTPDGGVGTWNGAPVATGMTDIANNAIGSTQLVCLNTGLVQTGAVSTATAVSSSLTATLTAQNTGGLNTPGDETPTVPATQTQAQMTMVTVTGVGTVPCWSITSVNAGETILTATYSINGGTTHATNQLVKEWNRIDGTTLTVTPTSTAGVFNVVETVRGHHVEQDGTRWSGNLEGVQVNLTGLSYTGAPSVTLDSPATGAVTQAVPYTATCAANSGTLLGYTASAHATNGSTAANLGFTVTAPSGTSGTLTVQVCDNYIGMVQSGAPVFGPEDASGTVTQPVVAKVPQIVWAGEELSLPVTETQLGLNSERQCTNNPNGGSNAVTYNVLAGAPVGTTVGYSSFSFPLYGVVGAPAGWTAILATANPGVVDVEAVAQNESGVICGKVNFVVYVLGLEDVTLSSVNGGRSGHNSGSFSPTNPWDNSARPYTGTGDLQTVLPTTDTLTPANVDVSKDQLLRARVRGWFTFPSVGGLPGNASTRPSETKNNRVLPAGRWVLPDDWAALAGVSGTRPQWDVMNVPDGYHGTLPAATGSTITGCGYMIGYYSPLDTGSCDALAWPAYSPYQSIFPDGLVNWFDAIMPPANVTFALTNPTAQIGFFKMADKSRIYYTQNVTYTETATKDATINGYDLSPVVGTTSTISGAVSTDSAGNYIGTTLNFLNQTGPILRILNASGVVVAYTCAGVPGCVSIATLLSSTNVVTGFVITWTAGYPNPYYQVQIPRTPDIPANVSNGGYLWNTGLQGLYPFWTPLNPSSGRSGTNSYGATVPSQYTGLNNNQPTQPTSVTVFSDNHGEAMVYLNGDSSNLFDAGVSPADNCPADVLTGAKICDQTNTVGTSTVIATVDYPYFRGQAGPAIQSNTITQTWLWGGYTKVVANAVGNGLTGYVEAHVLDRNGACTPYVGDPDIATKPASGLNTGWTPNQSDGKPDATVLGERIDMQITVGNGFWDPWGPNSHQVSGTTPVISNGGKTITGTTTAGSVDCVMSASLSNSENATDVAVTFHNPEGDIVIDVLVPTPNGFSGPATMNFGAGFTFFTWPTSSSSTTTGPFTLQPITGADAIRAYLNTNGLSGKWGALYYPQPGTSPVQYEYIFPSGTSVTLTNVQPGQVYLIYMFSAGTLTFN